MSFTSKLIVAIQNFAAADKIVVKTKDCCIECVPLGKATKCQESCAFDAISIIPDINKIHVDEAKCIGCGFCIEACPNKCFADKTQFNTKEVV